MEINSLEDMARMIAKRDDISFNEAMELIDNCAEEIDCAESLDEVEDTLAYWLGLEPDYLDLFIFN